MTIDLHQPHSQGLDPVTLGEGIYKIHLEASNVAIIDAGLIRFPDGSSYQGMLRGGKRCGQGRWVSSNGDEYVGAWYDDKRHGHGLQRYASSATSYEGEWTEDRRHGIGRESFSDGSVYEGRYEGNRVHGVGILTYPNGDVFEGEFAADVMNGKGLLTYGATGDIMAGSWVNNRRHGESMITFKATGKKFRCVWAMDTPGVMVPVV